MDNQIKRAILTIVGTGVLLGSPSAHAAAVTWTGATSTGFEIGTNWATGTPANSTTTDYAVFTGAPTSNQPALTVTRSIGGLQFGSSGWTLGGNFNLTTGGSITVGSTTNVGIDASAVTSGSNTISSGILLGTANQVWLIGTGGTLNANGAVTRSAAGNEIITVGDASNGGTLSLGGTADNGYLGVNIVNGEVDLNKTSSTGVHALGGNTTVNNGGILKLTGTGGDQIYFGVNVTVNNGGTFNLNGASESFSQLLAAAAGGTVTNSSGTASTMTATGGGTYAGAFTGNLSVVAGGGGVGGSTFSGSFTNTGDITYNGTTGNFLLSGSVNNTGKVINNGAGTGSFTASGAIGSNVTGVVQSSATSVMTLSNTANAFAGLAIKSGKVTLKTTGSQGLTTSAITLGDAANTGTAATLDFNGSSAFSGAFTNALSVVGTGVNTLTVTGFNPTYSGLITLDALSTGTGTDLNIVSNNNSNSSIFITGGIVGKGNLNLQVQGTNAGSSVQLNTTSINNVGTITNSGTGVGTTTIGAVIGSNVTGVIQNSATSALTLTGVNTFSGGVTIKAGTVNIQNSGLGTTLANVGTVTLGDVANTGAAATLNFNNGFLTASNAINVVGTGTRTISVTSFGPNLTGAVNLNSTNLNLITNNTGGSNLTISGGITGAGDLVLQSNAALTTNVNSRVILQTGSINNTGTITNSGTGSIGGTAVAGAIDTTISGVIGTNVTGVIQNSANSKLLLTAANTFKGDTTITLGTLRADNSAALQNSTVNMNGGTLAFGTAITSANVGGLAGSGNLTLINTNASPAAVNLQIGNSNTSYASNTLNPTYAGVISGAGTVTKVGSNTQTLSGANTYTGTTTVSAGTLLISGSLASGSAVTVNNSGALAGSGTTGVINGTFALAGTGKLGVSDGAAETLTFATGTANGVDISAAAGFGQGSLVFDLGAVGTSDKFVLNNAAGSLYIENGLLAFSDFSFNTMAGFGAGTYVLFDAASAINGSFDPGSVNGMIGGYSGTLSIDALNNDIILTVAAVPEPSTYALLGTGLFSLWALRRSRKTLKS